MSRVGRQPVGIPESVSVAFDDGLCVVKGPKGELSFRIHSSIGVQVMEDHIEISRSSDAPEERSLHGLTRSLVANMIEGVTEGFQKSLELRGTGYRAQLQGQNLIMTVGFSHPVELIPLEGIVFEVETPTLIHVIGIDKQVVGQQAALIRRVRPPEPYHGKGVRYVGEYVRQKAGKAKV
tara:strand:+ start:4228 stop:4764 length:537 start_codon:yes stop_codon:yes gene_type:complete